MSWTVHDMRASRELIYEVIHPWNLVSEEALVQWDRDVAPMLGPMPHNVRFHIHIGYTSASVYFEGWSTEPDKYFTRGRTRSVVWFAEKYGWESNYTYNTLELELS